MNLCSSLLTHSCWFNWLWTSLDMHDVWGSIARHTYFPMFYFTPTRRVLLPHNQWAGPGRVSSRMTYVKKRPSYTFITKGCGEISSLDVFSGLYWSESEPSNPELAPNSNYGVNLFQLLRPCSSLSPWKGDLGGDPSPRIFVGVAVGPLPLRQSLRRREGEGTWRCCSD